MRAAPNKIKWTKKEIDLIRKNWDKVTNKQLFQMLNKPISEHSMRVKLYEMGLYKLKLEFWTEEQVEFLKDNYKKIGDTEIAEIFNNKYPKNKGWSKKHIEKKRRYLNLKRTKEEISAIRLDWQKKGLYKESNRKMWITRGCRSIGDTVNWKGESFTKTQDGYIHTRIYIWNLHYGKVPEGMLVCHKDGDKTNCNINNLFLLTREENAIKTHSENYTIENLQTLVLLSRINRKIKQISKKGNYGKKQITGS